MSTNKHPTLTPAAARLARAAPKEWNEFLGAYTAYTAEQTAYCIASPLEELPRAQGRAQIAQKTLGILADCLEASNKIEGK